jgi:hypothetical protein
VSTLAKEVVEDAQHVLEDQSTNYTPVKVDEELRLMNKQGHQLREFMATSRVRIPSMVTMASRRYRDDREGAGESVKDDFRLERRELSGKM